MATIKPGSKFVLLQTVISKLADKHNLTDLRIETVMPDGLVHIYARRGDFMQHTTVTDIKYVKTTVARMAKDLPD